MDIYETTFELTLTSSKGVREAMKRRIPELCEKMNCLCTIDVETKWYWIGDKYKITVTGRTKDDIKYIKEQLDILVKVR